MNKRPIILITDTLFVNKKQESVLSQNGFEIERLPLFQASEDQLKTAITGKAGYILGGIEKVTEPVIEAADKLKALVFTGIDYKPFVPAWKKAEQKGISLGSTPDGPTQPTAEWALAATLLMNRRLLELGRPGQLTGVTTPGLENQKIGIIGFGRIGSRIAKMLAPFKPASLNFYNHNPKKIIKTDLATYLPLKKLLKSSDIIFLCIPSSNNKNFLGKKEFSLIKKDALLVSIASEEVVNEKELYPYLLTKKLRVATSHPFAEKFNRLPFSHYYCSNDGFASNTFASLEQTSEMAIQKLISLLNPS